MDWETTGGEGLCKKGGSSGLGDYGEKVCVRRVGVVDWETTGGEGL